MDISNANYGDMRLVLLAGDTAAPPMLVATPDVKVGEAPCAGCGAPLADQRVLIHQLDGFICAACFQARYPMPGIERCIDCRRPIRRGEHGERLAVDGGDVHECPRAGQNIYRLAAELRDRRRWRLAQERAS